MEASDQLTNLIKKIEQQDELIEKLKTEETKLSSYIHEFKQAMDRKLNKQLEQNNKSVVEDEKTEKLMEKEIENAKLVLKNYQNQLKALQKKNIKQKYTPEDLVQLEDSLRKKQMHLKELGEEIKNLNIVKRKQQKLIQKKQKNQNGIKLSKLVEEVRKQKQILEAQKLKLKQKQQLLEKRKSGIDQIYKTYVQKCEKASEVPINFEDYREKKHKKRQQSVNKIQQKKDKPKPQTIKDIINSHLDISTIQVSQKSLIELRQKRGVAENSLKIAKRKYEKQIDELESKLNQLKKQNQNLNQKYLQKKKQKQLIETSKTVDFKRNSSKANQKLDPLK